MRLKLAAFRSDLLSHIMVVQGLILELVSAKGLPRCAAISPGVKGYGL